MNSIIFVVARDFRDVDVKSLSVSGALLFSIPVCLEVTGLLFSFEEAITLKLSPMAHMELEVGFPAFWCTKK